MSFRRLAGGAAAPDLETQTIRAALHDLLDEIEEGTTATRAEWLLRGDGGQVTRAEADAALEICALCRDMRERLDDSDDLMAWRGEVERRKAAFQRPGYFARYPALKRAAQTMFNRLSNAFEEPLT